MATGPRLHPKGVRSDAHFWVPRPCQRVCWRPLAVTGLGVPLERSTSFWLCGARSVFFLWCAAQSWLQRFCCLLGPGGCSVDEDRTGPIAAPGSSL